MYILGYKNSKLVQSTCNWQAQSSLLFLLIISENHGTFDVCSSDDQKSIQLHIRFNLCGINNVFLFAFIKIELQVR